MVASLFLFSCSEDSDPCDQVPEGLVTLPINYDVFTWAVVLPMMNSAVFTKFMDYLDGSGAAAAQLTVPVLNPVAVGVSMSYAFAVGTPWDFASNPVDIKITQ